MLRLHITSDRNGNSSWSVSKTKLDKLKIHASEYSSIGLNYDYIVENNGTIDELHSKVHEIVNSQSVDRLLCTSFFLTTSTQFKQILRRLVCSICSKFINMKHSYLCRNKL
jgi:hypothetical protein